MLQAQIARRVVRVRLSREGDDDVIAKIRKYEELGYDEYSFWIDSGMSFDRKRQSLERFIENVMPAFT